jgi:membrane peptidoglycan carboxypeptidase
MKKVIFKIILLLLLLIILAFSILFLNGYSVYKDVTSKKSITEAIEKVRSDEHFVKLEDVAINYKNAVIAVEDHRYYDHGAVDFIAISRAIVRNIKSKDFVEGGSTITQQTAKNLYFIEYETNNNVGKKMAEALISIQLEKNYSKNDILEIYMNSIYFGNGYYGIYQASMGYFGKEPKDLSLYEASMLAGIPNAPSLYAPTVNFDLTKSRQKKVVRDMQDYGYITESQALELENYINSIQEFKLPEKETTAE